MNYRNEELAPKSTSLWARLTPKQKKIVDSFLVFFLVLIIISVCIVLYTYVEAPRRLEEDYVPDITIPSMDFTVLNITETRLNVKWDLVIRIPPVLPGYYMCLKGYFQAFILYKGVTIANSSLESYNLIPYWPQLLNASSIASEGDMDKVIVKDIMEDIKERGDMRFGSRLLLPDCRSGRKMNYTCDETVLRFEPGPQRKATAFENNATICHYVH